MLWEWLSNSNHTVTDDDPLHISDTLCIVKTVFCHQLAKNRGFWAQSKLYLPPLSPNPVELEAGKDIFIKGIHFGRVMTVNKDGPTSHGAAFGLVIHGS